MCASIFFLWRKLPISFIAHSAQGKMHSVTKRTLFFFCSCAMKDIPPHLSLTTLALTNCGTRKIAEKKRRGISGENSCCEKRGHENCRSSTYFFCAKSGKLLCPSTNAHGKKKEIPGTYPASREKLKRTNIHPPDTKIIFSSFFPLF